MHRPPETPLAHPRLFYGWWVVAASVLILATTSGLGFSNLSVLLQAFVAERGFSVSAASSATALFFVSSGAAGMSAGRLLERLDVRIIVTVSAAIGALALASIGWIRTLPQLYAFHIALGLGYGGCALVPVTTVVARWFERKRAVAMSIAMTGLSVGGALLTPAAAWLVNSVGLDGAALWMGAGFLIGIVPVTLLVLRGTPQSMGLSPDGRQPAASAINNTSDNGATWAEAWRTRFFWAVSVSYVFVLAAQIGAMSHVYSLGVERSDHATAAMCVAATSLASIVGRLIGGFLLLRISTRAATLLWMSIQAMALILVAVATDKYILLICIMLFGLSVGNLVMMQPLQLAEAFGTREYGRIYAASQFISIAGVAIGPVTLGLLHDLSDGYGVPYLCAALLGVCGIAALVLAGRPAGRAAA